MKNCKVEKRFLYFTRLTFSDKVVFRATRLTFSDKVVFRAKRANCWNLKCNWFLTWKFKLTVKFSNSQSSSEFSCQNTRRLLVDVFGEIEQASDSFCSYVCYYLKLWLPFVPLWPQFLVSSTLINYQAEVKVNLNIYAINNLY